MEWNGMEWKSCQGGPQGAGLYAGPSRLEARLRRIRRKIWREIAPRIFVPSNTLPLAQPFTFPRFQIFHIFKQLDLRIFKFHLNFNIFHTIQIFKDFALNCWKIKMNFRFSNRNLWKFERFEKHMKSWKSWNFVWISRFSRFSGFFFDFLRIRFENLETLTEVQDFSYS